jgi:hypothetical protein
MCYFHITYCLWDITIQVVYRQLKFKKLKTPLSVISILFFPISMNIISLYSIYQAQKPGFNLSFYPLTFLSNFLICIFFIFLQLVLCFKAFFSLQIISMLYHWFLYLQSYTSSVQFLLPV